MAELRVNVAFDMRLPSAFEAEGDEVAVTLTPSAYIERYTISTLAAHGTGFTYDAEGVFTGGTIQAFEKTATVGGAVLYRLDGLAMPTGVFLGYFDPVTDQFDLPAFLAAVFAGSDELYGSAGSDYLDGHAGNDYVFGGDANDTLLGGSGRDFLIGGSGADLMIGGTGDDFYEVDSAGDIVSESPGAGIDRVDTSISHVLAANVENVLIVGDGAINVTGNALGNVILVGDGDNVIDGGSGIDTVAYTYSGPVKVSLGLPGAQATGGSGSDTILNVERIVGSSGNDALTGSHLANTLSGEYGNDTLNGGSGADVMAGGPDNDGYIVDNAGDVVIEALNDGIDVVSSALAAYTLGANIDNGRIAQGGTASMTGNALSNLIYAGAGNNVINGGTGLDTVSYAFASAAVSVNLALTTAQATGGSGSDTLANIERATGGSFNDVLTGSSAANVLNGGAGNDVLNGGLGNDVLIGGLGLDTFRFTSALNATSNVDAVSGFVAADDRFLLSSAVFTQAGPAGALAASRFRIGSNAADADDRIVYEQTSGKLFYDADGTGASAKVLFATLAPNTVLGAGDFFIG